LSASRTTIRRGSAPVWKGQEVHHVPATPWASHAVRCLHCGERAREEVRERLSEEEIAVRYGCGHCGWRQSRQYHESELTAG